MVARIFKQKGTKSMTDFPSYGNSSAQTPSTALRVQRFDNLFNPTPSAELSLTDALQVIAHGTYAAAIQHVRRVWTREGEDAYKAAKAQLPQYTFAGTFAPTRAKANLLLHSEICHADIDHLGDVEQVKQRLSADPCVAYCFTSPRGDGLKYGVRIARVDSDDAYKHAWGTLAAAHLATYGVTWDPSGKDICRLCYVSWDPALYCNPDAQVYDVPLMIIPPPTPRPVPPVRVPGDRRERYAQRGIDQAVRIIAESVEGGLHAARCRAGYLLGGYVGGGLLSYAEAYDVLLEAVEGHTKHLTAALKTIADCLKAGETKPITEDELDADWEAWKAAHPLPPRSAAPITPPPTDNDPEVHAGFLAHRLPEHLANHPDPKVRKHWRWVYRQTNALKQRYIREGTAL
jgi:hypothetical protein